jgi:putative copper export protein
MRAGSVLGLLSALAFLALAGAQLQGADPRAVDLPAVADAARASANFERVVSAAIGFLIIAFASTGRFASRRRRLALGAGGLAIATSFAFASHVVAKSGSSFAYQVMIIAHIAMAAFWVGSLLPLFLILGDRERFYASAYLRAFSAIAGIGLLVIFATGAIMAMRLLNDFSELWTSDYGLRFGGKIAFILGLLLVATINRFFWTPRFELNTGKLAAHVARLGDRDFTRDTLRLAWDAQRPVRGLRNMISIDLVLAVGVVALTASLTLDQPPGAMGQMADRGGADRPELEMTGDDYRLTMPMPMPSRRTGRGFKVDIQDNGGAMIKPREATLSAQPLAVDLVPLKWRASADSTGTLSFADVRLPFAGQWQFAVDVLIDDFTTVRFERAIEFVPKSQAETPVVSSAAAQGARPVAAAERLR